MASIGRRTWSVRGKVKHGFQAQVRRKGYPTFTKLFRAYPDALKWSKAIEARLLLGEEVPRKDRTTVGALLQRYLTEVTPLKRGRDPERYRFLKIFRDTIACCAVAKLSSSAIASYRDRRLALVSPDTVIKELNLLSAVFETARKEWGYPLLRCSPI